MAGIRWFAVVFLQREMPQELPNSFKFVPSGWWEARIRRYENKQTGARDCDRIGIRMFDAAAVSSVAVLGATIEFYKWFFVRYRPWWCMLWVCLYYRRRDGSQSRADRVDRGVRCDRNVRLAQTFVRAVIGQSRFLAVPLKLPSVKHNPT